MIEAKCVKCGNTVIAMKYEYRIDVGAHEKDTKKVEWLNMTCVGCKYTWREECLDSPKRKSND